MVSDVLKTVARITGRKPVALELPDLPPQMAHVWSTYCDLHRGRPVGFNGPEPISYRQILDWKEATQGQISPRDVSTILKLDKIYEKVIQNG